MRFSIIFAIAFSPPPPVCFPAKLPPAQVGGTGGGWCNNAIGYRRREFGGSGWAGGNLMGKQAGEIMLLKMLLVMSYEEFKNAIILALTAIVYEILMKNIH